MKRRFIAGSVLVCVLILVIWLIWGNTALEITEYSITCDRLPEAFSGFRIAQISDLHNTEFDENNERLLSLLRRAEPDIIVITGDMIDSRRTDVDIALEFAEAAIDIAPVYYVTGNHEARLEAYKVLKSGLKAAGVVVLENEKVLPERQGECITLMGIHDPNFRTENQAGDSVSVTAQALETLWEEGNGYTILLAHRPELFETYVQAGVDLVFCGHTHGGQVRLPFLGGLVAPQQGLFPKYDAGKFVRQETTMIISRGLGNSIIPLRVNNRPEIVVAELS